jgi:hypothetical protein
VLYCHRAYSTSDPASIALRPVTPSILKLVTVSFTEEAACDALYEILQIFVNFFSLENRNSLLELLHSEWADNHIALLIEGDAPEEAVVYSKLLFAYASAEMEFFPPSWEVPSSAPVLQAMNKLAGSRFTGSEDAVWLPLIEYHLGFAESVVQSIQEADESTVLEATAAKTIIRTFLDQLCEGARFNPETMNGWISLDWDAFNSLRRDAAEFLQAVYPILGDDMLHNFINLAHKSMPRNDYEALEISIFGLTSLNDAISDNPDQDMHLASLVQSGILEQLLLIQYARKDRLLLTAVVFAEQFVALFERRPEILPQILQFLFGTLSIPKLGKSAGRAIFKVCSTCRKSLKSNAREIVGQYTESISKNAALDVYVKEKVLSAVASVVEALGPSQDQIQGLRLLIETLEPDIDRLRVADSGQTHVSGQDFELKEVTLSVLTSLTAIGKGMQSVDEVIDLEADFHTSPVWDSLEGIDLRRSIFHTIREVSEMFPKDVEIFQAACHTLRTGLRETTTGPFVFDKITIVTYLIEKGRVNLQPEIAIHTMSYVLVAQDLSENDSKQAGVMVLSFLNERVSAIEQDPGREPEIAQACVDCLIRFLKRYDSLLFEELTEITIRILNFSIKCIDASEPFTKRAACSFWTTLLTHQPEPQSLQPILKNIIVQLGPLLSKVIIFHVGGLSPRSELDNLSEPLRKLVICDKSAKQWIEAALNDPLFPSNKLEAQQKRIFLQKLISLRGSKGTHVVVKQFWLDCRGSLFQYAS